MSKIFTLIDSIFVPASAPYPVNTQYKISIGYEKWATPEKVLKIQMVYNGKLSCRRSDSYSVNIINCIDYKNIKKATDALLKKYNIGVSNLNYRSFLGKPRTE